MDKKLITQQTGYIAECYVVLELAKRGIYCSNLSGDFDFDLITDLGIRIEVKSSRVGVAYPGKDFKKKKFDNPHKRFSFMNIATKDVRMGVDGLYKRKTVGKDRFCDFFVCVCFNKDLTINRTYIFPKSIIGNRQAITIPFKRTNRKIMKGCINTEQYLEKWDLIDNFYVKKFPFRVVEE